MTTKKAQKAAEIAEAIESLRKLIKPGDTIYCVLRSRSSSGMSRVIDLLIPYREVITEYPPLPADKAEYPGQRDYNAKPKTKAGKLRIRSIGWTASKAMERTHDSDKGGISIAGCGMDMGFALVYDLGRTLYPKGAKGSALREGQKDGGYAFKHEWL
jgi:hypothetical protein